MTDDVKRHNNNTAYIHDEGDIEIFIRLHQKGAVFQITQQAYQTHHSGDAIMLFKNLDALIETLQAMRDDWEGAEEILPSHVQAVHESIWKPRP